MENKILYIHHAGELGGAPKSLSILLNNLNIKLFKPYVFMLIDGTAKDLFKNNNIELIISRRKLHSFHGTTVSGMNLRTFLTNYLYIIPNAITAYKLLKKVKPQLIHLNTSCMFIYAFISKVFFPKIKVISHIREPLLPNIHGRILNFFNNKFTDFLIPINEFEATHFNKNKLEVIKNSIDTEKYKLNQAIRIEQRDKLGLSKEEFIIGFFARFNIENGIEDLIKLAQSLLTINEKIKLLVFGYDPYKIDEKSRKIANNMPKNVIIKGMIKDVHIKMQSIDVLISPFKTPHFSRSIIEAQSLSIPVLVSNVDSQNTLLKDKETGFIYHFGDIEEIINKILFLKTNTILLNTMKKNSRIYAEKEFCFNTNNNKVYSIYKKLLNNDN